MSIELNRYDGWICVPNKLTTDTLMKFLVKSKCDTYKLHGAGVGKEVLNIDTPVWSESEISFTL